MSINSSGVYLALKQCGCVAVIISDLEDQPKWTAKEVAGCIKEGYRVERLTNEQYRNAGLVFGARCPHGPRQMQLSEAQ